MTISIFKYSFVAILFLSTFTAQGQSKDAVKSDKYETIQFKVSGVCPMCQSRIEMAVYDLKGVKSAKWDLESSELTTVVKKGKVTKEQIAEALAVAGHSSELAKAKQKSYDALPDCCKYDDPGIEKHGMEDGHGHN